MIEIDEIRNFPRETVKIEGVLTGYVRDPYGEGADRIDLQVQEINGHSVAKVRWNVDWNNDVPPLARLLQLKVRSLSGMVGFGFNQMAMVR